ncbi:YciI family protein [Paenibacillus aestuarii]|uniref:YciI family protein n=1 Tax=Paenibacillus aestuarii TaxID=516965 RepID=A0ABW0K8K8_9BACL|nr:YciI family protein [Paenibacillus aestuarii]
MKYFAVLLPMKDEELSKEHRPAHLAYLEARRSEGKIFANGRFVDGWGGLVIYKAESFEEVQAIVEEDPYVKLGARHCEIHEWDLVM